MQAQEQEQEKYFRTATKEDEEESCYLDDLLSQMLVIQEAANKGVPMHLQQDSTSTTVQQQALYKCCAIARIRPQRQQRTVTPTKTQNNTTAILHTPFCASLPDAQDPQSHLRDCQVWSLYSQSWELNTITMHNCGALWWTYLTSTTSPEAPPTPRLVPFPMMTLAFSAQHLKFRSAIWEVFHLLCLSSC